MKSKAFLFCLFICTLINSRTIAQFHQKIYKDSLLQSEGVFKNGKLITGVENVYGYNSSFKLILKKVIEYKNGVIVSVCSIHGSPLKKYKAYFSKTGNVSKLVEIQNGDKEVSFSGYQSVYNAENILVYTGNWVNGKMQDGKEYVYDANGYLVQIKLYKNGKYTSDDPSFLSIGDSVSIKSPLTIMDSSLYSYQLKKWEFKIPSDYNEPEITLSFPVLNSTKDTLIFWKGSSQAWCTIQLGPKKIAPGQTAEMKIHFDLMPLRNGRTKYDNRLGLKFANSKHEMWLLYLMYFEK